MHILEQLQHPSFYSCRSRLFDHLKITSDLDRASCHILLPRIGAHFSSILQGLAQKSKIQLEALRKLADHARNYHEYRSRLRNTAPPAVPFLGK